MNEAQTGNFYIYYISFTECCRFIFLVYYDSVGAFSSHKSGWHICVMYTLQPEKGRKRKREQGRRRGKNDDKVAKNQASNDACTVNKRNRCLWQPDNKICMQNIFGAVGDGDGAKVLIIKLNTHTYTAAHNRLIESGFNCILIKNTKWNNNSLQNCMIFYFKLILWEFTIFIANHMPSRGNSIKK